MKILCILALIFSTTLMADESEKIPNSCPFSVSISKDDRELFNELQNYFQMLNNNPECAQASAEGMKTVEELKSLMTSNEGKCFTNNIKQTKLRDAALASIDKGLNIDSSSPYKDCNFGSKDKMSSCVNTKFSTHTQDCKGVAISQPIQDKLTKGMGDLQKIVSKNEASKGKCGAKDDETLSVVMDTAKTISGFIPLWGTVAGVGISLVDSAIDNYKANDAQEMANTMDALLNKDNYERVACMYYSLQQKIYCVDESNKGIISDPRCLKDNSGKDLIRLLENVQEIKKATDEVVGPGDSSNTADTSYLEANIEDLTKYSLASETDIRERIKTLPKIQQAKELEKINFFFKMLTIYQYSNSDTELGINAGKRALDEIMPLLYSTDPSVRINFEHLVFKSNPGLKLDVIKQRGLVFALKNFQKENVEESRRMAQLSKFKSTMNEVGQSDMKSQLIKKYDGFKGHLKSVMKENKGIVSDAESEGMLRDIVRHCALMQEIYDPQLEGKIPDQCANINCGNENRLHWFIPKDSQNNTALFKKSYCEKSSNFRNIEDEYVKELKDSSGARMCGTKIENIIKE
jgi:hypothetical protein